MKISHIDLESCFRSPRQWLRDKASGGHPFKIGYDQILKFAIRRYHRDNSVKEARRHLQKLIEAHELKNAARISEIKAAIISYHEWCEANSIHTADSMIRILLDIGGYLQLSGIVSRVDVIGEGYRGILLGPYKQNWEDQLRMPLLQKALAERYQKSLDSFGEIGRAHV